MYKSIPQSLYTDIRIYQLVKTMDKKKEIENKNSDTMGKDTMVNMDGVDVDVLNKLKEKKLLGEIISVFGNRAAEYIRKHVYLDGGKLVIRNMQNEFRYINNIPIKTLDLANRYGLINGIIVVKLANFGVIYEYVNNNGKLDGLYLKKQKNGSYRISIRKNDYTFTIG